MTALSYVVQAVCTTCDSGALVVVAPAQVMRARCGPCLQAGATTTGPLVDDGLIRPVPRTPWDSIHLPALPEERAADLPGYVHPAPPMVLTVVSPDSGWVPKGARDLAKLAEVNDWSVTLTATQGWTLPWNAAGAKAESKLVEMLALRMWQFPDRRAVAVYQDGVFKLSFCWSGRPGSMAQCKITALKARLIDRGE